MKDFFEELRASDDPFGYLADHKKELIRYVAFAVGVLAVALLLLYRGGDETEITTTEETLRAEESAEGVNSEGEVSGNPAAGISDDGVMIGNGDLYVDIGGAVKTPKLAMLPAGSRVEDAITEAGGLTSDADMSTINRAEVLVDGQKIYIPKKGEAGYVPGGVGTGGAADGTGGAIAGAGGAVGTGGQGAAASGKVNINTADITQLQTLTGVGPVTAQKILDYRNQKGRFSTIEDLKNVSGIGDKTFEKMKDQVTV